VRRPPIKNKTRWDYRKAGCPEVAFGKRSTVEALVRFRSMKRGRRTDVRRPRQKRVTGVRRGRDKIFF
jgi:hypothetical protein